MNLSDLKIVQVGMITRINMPKGELKRHLLDMGFTKGVKVKIKRIAPTGDPINVELRGYEIAIRKDDLKQIEVSIV